MSSSSTYSIKNLESLTNIRSHTIRIWEKRYNLLSPARTDTNLRLYSGDDLRKLLNVALLSENGFRISAIARMTEEELRKHVLSIRSVDTSDESLIERLVAAMLDLDEEEFSQIIDSIVLKSGFEDCIEQVVFPFFIRIGVMWQTGSINPAQEHFVSALVRQKIISAINSLPVAGAAEPPVILFLPEKELHELSLLYYNYVLRSRGYRTLYLGQVVPADALGRIIEVTKCGLMVFVATNTSDMEETVASLREIESFGVKVLCSGYLMKHTDLSDYPLTSYFDNKAELLQAITKKANT
jgi:MerR family transcriptional regulator, light-induced transcriptional regulator